jgi:hypothetical protein
VAYAPRGTKSFHLTFSSANRNPQHITLTQQFIPASTSQLSFYSAKRFRSAGNLFRIQVSTNEGSSWEDALSVPTTSSVTSTGSANFDSALKSTTGVSLAAWAGRLCQLRLRFENTGSIPVISGSIHNYGVFVDDIAISNVTLINAMQSTDVPAASVVNNKINLLPAMGVGGALTPGASYRMTYAPKMGSHTFDAAPVISITPSPTAGVGGWIEGFYPSLVGVPVTVDSDRDGMPNLVEFALGLDPTAKNAPPPTTFSSGTLSMTLPENSTNASVATAVQYSCDMVNWQDLTPVIANGLRVYTKPANGATCGFLRIKARQL